ncbi:thioredoxin domain-containing protein [Thalassobaculum sp.]|uniref:DsbA family protein n=1 Tax=Thalassobaculum sp. TaxID=2022740 RepID=UPI0032EE5ACF
MTRKTLVLAILVLAIAAFAGGTWYVNRPITVAKAVPIAREEGETLTRSHSPILGPAEAPVTIVEFFDPACEACRAFYPIVKDIMAEHGASIRVVLRYTPLHGEVSEQAVRILEAARMQGVFEPVLEALLREQPQWARHGASGDLGLLLQIAATAGLDAEAARTQMLSPSTVGILNRDRADVKTAGVRGTPTFFVNGRRLDPFGEAELRALVAEEVAASGA